MIGKVYQRSIQAWNTSRQRGRTEGSTSPGGSISWNSDHLLFHTRLSFIITDTPVSSIANRASVVSYKTDYSDALGYLSGIKSPETRGMRARSYIPPCSQQESVACEGLPRLCAPSASNHFVITGRSPNATRALTPARAHPPVNCLGPSPTKIRLSGLNKRPKELFVYCIVSSQDDILFLAPPLLQYSSP